MLVTRSNGRHGAQLAAHAAQLNAGGLGTHGTATSQGRQAEARSATGTRARHARARPGRGLGTTPRPPNRTHITRQGKTDKNTGHLPDFRVVLAKVIKA